MVFYVYILYYLCIEFKIVVVIVESRVPRLLNVRFTDKRASGHVSSSEILNKMYLVSI